MAYKNRKNERRKYFKDNPLCAFCGGNRIATTIEHCPPRVFFRGRVWPETFNFPMCKECNKSTSTHDLIFTVMTRISLDSVQYIDAEWNQALVDLRRHLGEALWSKFIDDMHISYRDEHFIAMRMGKSNLKELIGNFKAIRLPDLAKMSIQSVAKKLAKGVYYKTCESIFPSDGVILMILVTNLELIGGNFDELVDNLGALPGIPVITKRMNAYMSDQFKLRISLSSDKKFFLMVAAFAESIIVITIGFTDQSLADGWMESCTSKEKSFGQIIQHPLIMT